MSPARRPDIQAGKVLSVLSLGAAGWHDAMVRVFAGGLGALIGLALLSFGILLTLARSRWPGQ